MSPPGPNAIDLAQIIKDARSRVKANGGKEDPKFVDQVDRSLDKYTENIPKRTYESIVAELEPKSPAPGG